AGCSLADSCPADKFEEFVKAHPDHTVISYVNTTAAVKALTDVVVTSTNAKKIVDQFPQDAKLIFGPDKNLGNYINSVTGRNMLLWDGACHVHEQFSLEKLIDLKRENPDAEITESGILHQMTKANPDKIFIPVPPEFEGKTCMCNECKYMRMNTMEKLYACLRDEKPEILIEEDLRLKAVKPILRMLEMS
ncbi:MAG: quinolinate synthetase, partial [Bacteroidetes bacterium]|nr:quinolinate synthetase [Bacteroidota bacterium]